MVKRRGSGALAAFYPRLSELKRELLRKRSEFSNKFFVIFHENRLFISFRNSDPLGRIEKRDLYFLLMSSEKVTIRPYRFAVNSEKDLELFLKELCHLWGYKYEEIFEHELGDTYQVWQLKPKGV